MLNRIFPLFTFLAALSCAVLLADTAQAQSITLGGDDEQIYNVLRQNGYTQAKITKRKLTIVRTEACKGTDKFQVKISILGRITSVNKIGTCPQNAKVRGFTREDAVSSLHRDGFTEISAERRGRRITATACRQNRRYELAFNRRGQLTNRRDIGSCAAVGLNRAQIEEIMHTEGYTRVVVTDDQLPKYVAEACRGNDKIRVTMNRRGRVRSERRIGDCARQFNPGNLKALMQDKGYDRIKIVDDRRPPYVVRACKGADRMEVSIGRYGRLRRQNRLRACRSVIDPTTIAGVLQSNGYDRVRVLRKNRTPYLAEACKNDNLIELTIGRYGRIQKEERVGRCSQPITETALKDKLSKEGFINVGLTRRGDGWRAEVCRNEVKVAIRIDAYGDLVRERNIGACTSHTVLDVLKKLENRGAQQTSVQVIGCYRNTKYRWIFDRLGNRTGRERVGRC
ncbi:MAG: hypothetical protein V3V02_05380 [Rhizobiaceae bacterium]